MEFIKQKNRIKKHYKKQWKREMEERYRPPGVVAFPFGEKRREEGVRNVIRGEKGWESWEEKKERQKETGFLGIRMVDLNRHMGSGGGWKNESDSGRGGVAVVVNVRWQVVEAAGGDIYCFITFLGMEWRPRLFLFRVGLSISGIETYSWCPPIPAKNWGLGKEECWRLGGGEWWWMWVVVF